MVLGAVRTAIGGGLTEEDIRLISNRREQLKRFERLLNDPDYFQQEESLATTRGAEAVWQAFFEANQWIFGYGLNLIACESIDEGKLERITTGADIFGGVGKRIDAIMRSRGLISSMLFCEIKTHDTELLAKTPYRAGVYQASKELGGGVAQVRVAYALPSPGPGLREAHRQFGGNDPLVDERGHEPPARPAGTLNNPGASSTSQPRATRCFAFDRTPSTFTGTGASPNATAGCRQSIASPPDRTGSATMPMSRR